MRKRLAAFALPGLALLWSSAPLSAAQFGTAEDAKAMLHRAVEALNVNVAAALKAFNDEKSKEFRSRDLSIFCFSLPDGNITAYESPLMVGTNVRELKLGKDPLGQRAYDVVAGAPEGEFVTVDYDFPKPGTKQAATKQSLETRVGNQACGVSYFK